MCGITGILHRGTVRDGPERARAMAAAIRHRGPDDEGNWADADIALGFVRLSILDLNGGHQPMTNEDGSAWVVFNGEIYNHAELRRELTSRGHRFATDHSDTEVLVHGWEEWGEQLPERLNGMFAFALWDCRQRALFLARDRYGIKPLYVATGAAGELLFGSEIRALHASGLIQRAPSDTRVIEYFLHQNLWGSETLFAGVEIFPPGTKERIDADGRRRARYWDYTFERRSRVSLAEAADRHRGILQEVVKRQIAADVPVMSYLSGGIDSSSLCAAAFRLDPRLRAYSCIFDLDEVGDDRIVDEREFSRAVARHLAIEHVELELPQDALVTALRPTIRALEEPRMGMSYVNYLIAGRVARDSKVVLSGTGGDELHGGYVYRYQATAPVTELRPFSRAWLKGLASRLRNGMLRDRLPLGRLIGMVNYPLQETRLAEAFTPEFLRAAGSPGTVASHIEELLRGCPSEHIWDQLMYVDARTYLHGLLVIEDKLSMAHSLETRVPLLDNELVDYVCSLPWRLLFDGQTGKIVFRESVRPLVPDAVYRKPKMGFGPPDASWYRSRLRPFVTATLAPERITRRGVLQPAFVERALGEHFAGRANHVALIWSLLSFEAWCEEFGMYGGAL
jgi:asparagine synthase (glutamine-hydrolysing)